MKRKIVLVWFVFLSVIISLSFSCIPMREGEKIKIYTHKDLDTLKRENEKMKNDVSQLTGRLDSVLGIMSSKLLRLRKDKIELDSLSCNIDALELKLLNGDTLLQEVRLSFEILEIKVDSLKTVSGKHELTIAILKEELKALKKEEGEVKEEIDKSLKDSGARSEQFRNVEFHYCAVDLKKYQVEIHHLDDNGRPHGSLGSVQKMMLESGDDEIMCLMNGGMYQEDRNPEGLLVINSEERFSVDKKQCSSRGPNFYLGAENFPNGIFFIMKDGSSGIIQSTAYEDWTQNKEIKFATQSGPMLMFEGTINPTFRDGSNNKRVRNGVGIMNDGKLIVAISEEPVNLFDFAQFFNTHGCKTSLYLDGVVSRAYIPMLQLEDLKGNFGPIISIVKK